MKKIVCLLLSICLVFSLSLSAFAEKDVEGVEARLEKLEKTKNENLHSLVEQLKAQGRMDHFEIHKKLLLQDYEYEKNKIKGEKDSFSTSSISYVAPYGGQYDYYFESAYPHRVIDEYYYGTQLNLITKAYGPTYTLGGFSNLVVVTIAGLKIPQIGVALAGYSLMDYLINYLSAATLETIDKYGYGYNRTVAGTYSSTAWFKWTSYPDVPRNSEAATHKFTWFTQLQQ